MNQLKLENIPSSQKYDPMLTQIESHNTFWLELKRSSIFEALKIITYHPFKVISVRMMVQIVDKDDKYKNLFGSFLDVFRDYGIFGFFTGIVPIFLKELGISIGCEILTYFVGGQWQLFNGADETQREIFMFLITVVFFSIAQI